MSAITTPQVQQPADKPRHRKRWIVAGLAAAVATSGAIGVGVGLMIGGGGQAQPPASTPSISQQPQQSSPASHASPSAAAISKRNDRQFAYWLASASTSHKQVDNAIAGPVMHGYVAFEANIAAAYAAEGQPYSPGSVVPIAGGYQMVSDDGSGGTSIETFTAFQHDATGRITDLEVNGQPIAPRLALGTDNTGHLKITDVVAYRPAAQNEVWIVFKVKNIGAALNNGDFLTTFSPPGAGQLQEDWQNSPTVPTLHPAESAYVLAIFGTRRPVGTLTLRSNDGYDTVYASSKLTRP